MALKLSKKGSLIKIVCQNECMQLSVVLILQVRKIRHFFWSYKHDFYVNFILNWIEEYVMLEICRQFPMPIIQYVCVSSDSPTSPLPNTNSSSVIYVQILLKRKLNKRGWFLDKVTGTKHFIK